MTTNCRCATNLAILSEVYWYEIIINRNVPIKSFALEMSSSVLYFEQFVWGLENRGVADIDVPVLIVGIDV